MGSNHGQDDRASRPVDPQLSRQVDVFETSLEDLLRAAESARALLGSPGWAVLSSALSAEISKIDALLDGDRLLESRAEYAQKHGRRSGLRAPEEFLHALLDRAESRLAEQRAKHEGDAESSPEGI